MWGVIGGSGLYALDGLTVEREVRPETPFGAPSSAITVGSLGSKKVAFLARHGAGHVLLPTEVNYRANIFALKQLGVTKLLSVSAVGSLRTGLEPGDFCLPSQFLDWTRGKRSYSFFGEGMVGHLAASHPTCDALARCIAEIASGEKLKSRAHRNVTYVCVEGPRLSTQAESFMFRSFGADIIGMTAVPEVFLAAEANMHYQTVSIVTDYDCWQTGPSLHVAPDKIISFFQSRMSVVRDLLSETISTFDEKAAEARIPKAFVITPAEKLSDTHRAVLDVLQR